jgi:hypothetical protein
VADAWMPGTRCIRAETDGGKLGGGAPRVVWMTLGADPCLISVWSAAQRLNQENRPCHLVWDPQTGDIAQLLPIVRAGCEPFTSYQMVGLGEILDWLDSWQIPRRWPAGPPDPYRQAGRPRSRALWAQGGHFGASQVPDCDSIGPGGIDIDQLVGTHSIARELPEPSAAQPAAIRLGPRTAQVVAAV